MTPVCPHLRPIIKGSKALGLRRMALFSARTLIGARIALLTFVAYHLLVSPRTVIEYSGVLVLASSMDLPLLMVNEKSPIYGTIGVVLITLLLSDIAALLDGNMKYFETTVFCRLLFFFPLCAYCYLGTWVVLCNSVIFSYAFIEAWFGILTFSTLKEEKMNRARDHAKKEAEFKEKYERGELQGEEKKKYEKKLEKEEYDKIMNEFKS